jgi:hypothetical protein
MLEHSWNVNILHRFYVSVVCKYGGHVSYKRAFVIRPSDAYIIFYAGTLFLTGEAARV